MIGIISACLSVFLNLTIYFLFGSLITPFFKERRLSATLSVITGFFLYYILFEAICIPVMMLLRPLSLLAKIWSSVLILLSLLSVIINRKRFAGLFSETLIFIRKHRVFVTVMTLLILAEALMIIRAYHFTYDAAYYVGTASTSLFTDTIKIYDPYTGMWQDHFEMRYFLSNYAVNDAVMCYLLNLHPLLWTRTVMEGTVVMLTGFVTYRLGRALFNEDLEKTGLFIFFSLFASFFFSTIYTPQEFLVTRTYEGKTVLGDFVLPLLILVYIKLLSDHRDAFSWMLLLMISLGSPVLSNSAGMLIPAALAVYMLPLTLIKKDPKILIKTGGLMIPPLFTVILYVLYVKGFFVIYTMPGR